MSESVERSREGSQAISLDDLIAFNAELAALVNAGVPLEAGLDQVSGDVNSALAELTAGISARMKSGQSLSAALETGTARLPAAYRAVVNAGERLGRLTDVLESVATFTISLRDLRRTIGRALIYPALVAWLAYLLAVGFLVQVFESYEQLFEVNRMEPTAVYLITAGLRDSLPYWFWLPPAVLIALSGLWMASNRASVLGAGGISRVLVWVPGMSRFLRLYRTASFTSLLALLLKHEVPLPDAVTLAADASGDRALRRTATQFSAAVIQGHKPDLAPGVLPPFVCWLLCRGTDLGVLCEQLEKASEMYARRAELQADWIRFGFPALAAAGLGGTVVLGYALLFVLPFVDVIRKLTFL